MDSNYEIKFVNKSKKDFCFWEELGMSDSMKMLRLRPGQALDLKVFSDNLWANFESVTQRDITDDAGNVHPILEVKKRKGMEQKPVNGGKMLNVNLEWDYRTEGNGPSQFYSYRIDDDRKMNLMVNVPVKVEVPAETHPAKFEDLILISEQKVMDTEYTPFRYQNFFTLKLVNRRES